MLGRQNLPQTNSEHGNHNNNNDDQQQHNGDDDNQGQVGCRKDCRDWKRHTAQLRGRTVEAQKTVVNLQNKPTLSI